MNVDRRGFFKLGGAALLGILAKPVYDLLSARRTEAAAKMAESPVARRLGMVVDLKTCTAQDGCRDCITACHRAHNVPDIGNAKGEVKWLWTVTYEEAFPGLNPQFGNEVQKGRPVMALCNHCDQPPCVSVCPTKATWRREDGIVMMDYHRCIGCRYCMAACPYGSRSFNWRDPRPFIPEPNPDFPTRTKGVVEKCNFCEERLAQGFLPACVEACKEKSLVFGDLSQANSDIRRILRDNYVIQRKGDLGTRPQVYYKV